MQDGEADNFLAFVAHDDILVSQVTIRSVNWLFKVDVEHISFSII